MTHYLRAFCTAVQVPRPAALQHWLRQKGSFAVLDEPEHAAQAARDWLPVTSVLDLQAEGWERLGLAYKLGKAPVLAECNRGDAGPLMRAEIDEFIQRVNAAARNEAARRVRDHLRATRFVVACRHPEDIDNDGRNAARDLVAHFVAHSGGLLQVDGKGFYEGEKLAVPLH